jgi:hypothetical protein
MVRPTFPAGHTDISNSLWRSRLLENGGDYFDLKTFPEGEARAALQRVWNRKMGKRFNEGSGPVEMYKKKKKKVDAQPKPLSPTLADGIANLRL